MFSSAHSSVLTSTNSTSQTTTHLENHHFVETVHQLLKDQEDIKGTEMSGSVPWTCDQLSECVEHICLYLITDRHFTLIDVCPLTPVHSRVHPVCPVDCLTYSHAPKTTLYTPCNHMHCFIH